MVNQALSQNPLASEAYVHGTPNQRPDYESLALELQKEFRGLQRQSHLLLGGGTALATLTSPLVVAAPDIGFPVMLIVLTLACGWYLNINAESTAIAQYRNYVCELGNKGRPERPYRFGDINDVGQGHPATMWIGAGPALVIIGLIVSGFCNVIYSPFAAWTKYSLPEPAAWLVISLASAYSITSLVAAMLANTDYRERAYLKLFPASAQAAADPSGPGEPGLPSAEVSGGTEPSDGHLIAVPAALTQPAAAARRSWYKRLAILVFRRDNQGYRPNVP